VLLEEEYRDEIRYYMHDMEVSPTRFKKKRRRSNCSLIQIPAFHDVLDSVYGPAA
jgi:hypothetical protein